MPGRAERRTHHADRLDLALRGLLGRRAVLAQVLEPVQRIRERHARKREYRRRQQRAERYAKGRSRKIHFQVRLRRLPRRLNRSRA